MSPIGIASAHLESLERRKDHLREARPLPGFSFSINKPVVIPQRLSLSVFAPQALAASRSRGLAR